MAFVKRGLMAAALVALGACASAPEQAVSQNAAPSAFAGKSVLDAAIEAAGGEAALAQVKELEWKGTATVTAGGKTTVIDLETVIRPTMHWGRTTSWPKDEGPKKAQTIQVEQGKAWLVKGVMWNPMPEAQALHENQQFALYPMMMLTPLKEPGAKVTEEPAGKDGTRAIKGVLATGFGGELEFDASAKLVRAGLVVKDPADSTKEIVETVKFSGEMESNGVKWPKRIVIEQGGQPYFDLELSSFEATPNLKPHPLQHTLDDGQPAPGRPTDAG